MPKSFYRLRFELGEREIEQQDIAARWGCSDAYISQKINGRTSFKLWEAYDLLRMLEIPPDQFALYFPPEDAPRARP